MTAIIKKIGNIIFAPIHFWPVLQESRLRFFMCKVLKSPKKETALRL